MMSKRALFFTVTLFFLITWSVSSQAIVVSGLYQASVPLSGMTPDEEAEALAAALAVVVVKATGDLNAVTNPELEEGFANPQAYLSRYSYEQVESNNPLDESNSTSLHLEAVFDASLVNRWLSEAGLRIWGSSRPLLLTWLAVEEYGRRLLVGEYSDLSSNPTITIRNYALQYGLPVVIPLLDLVDVNAVSVTDVWGLFPTDLQSASARYNPDGLLLARIRQQSNGLYELQWSLSIDGVDRRFRQESASLDVGIETGLGQIASYLAERYGVKREIGSIDSSIALRVTDVNSVDVYADIEKYLNNMTAVSNIIIGEISQDEIVYNVALAGSIESFARQLQLDGVLVQSEVYIEPRSGNTLYYRYAL